MAIKGNVGQGFLPEPMIPLEPEVILAKSFGEMPCGMFNANREMRNPDDTEERIIQMSQKYCRGLIDQGMEPERRDKPDKPNRLNRPERPNCSGPDPYGLGTTISGVIPANTGIHSQSIARRVLKKGRATRGSGWIDKSKHNLKAVYF